MPLSPGNDHAGVIFGPCASVEFRQNALSVRTIGSCTVVLEQEPPTRPCCVVKIKFTMSQLFDAWQLADEVLTETEHLIAKASSRFRDKEGLGPTNLQLAVARRLSETARECVRKARSRIVDAPNAFAASVATRELHDMQSARGDRGLAREKDGSGSGRLS